MCWIFALKVRQLFIWIMVPGNQRSFIAPKEGTSAAERRLMELYPMAREWTYELYRGLCTDLDIIMDMALYKMHKDY